MKELIQIHSVIQLVLKFAEKNILQYSLNWWFLNIRWTEQLCHIRWTEPFISSLNWTGSLYHYMRTVRVTESSRNSKFAEQNIRIRVTEHSRN